MHPSDCPSWEYNQLPHHAEILLGRIKAILIQLRTGQIDTEACCTDSRQVHKALFSGLTPPQCPYYAGHYRGEVFRCLQHYRVQIKSDPKVGYSPDIVRIALSELAPVVRSGLAALDSAARLPESQLSSEDKLLYVVTFACRVFEVFLRIHPYANGNGHIGRFIIWYVLGRYRYWPVKWPIEPRPPDPPYSDLIAKYRDGDREPLESFVLNCITG